MTTADDKIQECLDQRKSFILDAGAGSGKTYSLVEVLRYLIGSGIGAQLARNSQRIACITFTNIAKDQVIEGTGGSPLLHVSTIHDFLWTLGKPHQKALKRALVRHNNELNADSKRRRDPAELEAALKTVGISYSDRGAEFLEGRLFHDDLLNVMRILFEDNPLIAKITAARYPYIFVDEYQDTSKAVIDILINRILAANEHKAVLGFFGVFLR
jgi:DNA helicase-2/ATP-dependent DNA helicase PcrA